MNRRALLVGVVVSLAASPAMARGMYCTRHPSACRERREREARDAERERQRRAALTPEQRAKEDAEAARRDAEMRAKWAEEEAARQREWKAQKSMFFSIFGTAAGIACAIGGLIWLEKRQ